MNKNKNSYEGTIQKSYIKKEVLKTSIILFTIYMGMFIASWGILYLVSIDEGFAFPLALMSIISLCVALFFIFCILLDYIYERAYYHNFSFHILEDNILIHHGVFTKVKASIPYSRIQNINVTNGVFDRIFSLFTVKIETAGSSAAAQAAQGGIVKPEGYIPGLKDPDIIEEKIKEMINRYASIPSGLEDKVFKPEELAFDNFISYILSKMREGEHLKTSIKELREKRNWSLAQLAEKVDVPVQTINFLEEGRYNPSLTLAYKIANVLDCTIEDLFKMQ